MKLENKSVLITASTRGIGLACVKTLAKEGAKVYMAARNLERAKEEAAKLNADGCFVKCVYNDALNESSYKSMIDDVIKDCGKIDVLVNNFGTSNTKTDLDFANTDVETFLNILNTNLKSVYIASQYALKYMAQKGSGSIINISSISGNVPDISQVAYGTSKNAINYLTKLIAVHEAKNNIRCNAILPGMTETDAVKENLSEEFKNLFLKHIPLNRMAKPEEIAKAVSFLASDDSSYITGQIISVSGGFGLATPIYGDLKKQAAKR